MALSSTGEKLYAHAKAMLPRWLFQKDTAPQEMLGAFAAILDGARAQGEEWIAQTYITQASGIWLDQHARDRGTTRRAGENDATLAARLRTPEAAVTIPALTAGIQAILAAAGVSTTVGVFSLRQVRAFMHGTGVGASTAFLSRGYRMTNAQLPGVLLVILPYGTDSVTLASVTEYLRTHMAAGFKLIVEVRGIP